MRKYKYLSKFFAWGKPNLLSSLICHAKKNSNLRLDKIKIEFIKHIILFQNPKMLLKNNTLRLLVKCTFYVDKELFFLKKFQFEVS